MTTSTLEKRGPRPAEIMARPPELTTVNTFEAQWAAMRQVAETLVRSEFLPVHLRQVDRALAVILAGRELGLEPMSSIRHLWVDKGKVSSSAELMLALARRRIPGLKFYFEKDGTDGEAVAVCERPGEPAHRARFTHGDAQKAGLLGKDNWRNYQPAMLRARATSAVLRIACPDATMGLLTHDEAGFVETPDGLVAGLPPVPAAHAIMVGRPPLQIGVVAVEAVSPADLAAAHPLTTATSQEAPRTGSSSPADEPLEQIIFRVKQRGMRLGLFTAASKGEKPMAKFYSRFGKGAADDLDRREALALDAALAALEVAPPIADLAFPPPACLAVVTERATGRDLLALEGAAS